MDIPYDQALEPGPRRRATRTAVQSIVGGVIVALVLLGIDIPAEAATALTVAAVALVGIIQNGYDAARS